VKRCLKYLFGFRNFENPWVFENTELDILKVFSETLLWLSKTFQVFSETELVFWQTHVA